MRDLNPAAATRGLAASLLALSLAACMVGPDHVRPSLPASGEFTHEPAADPLAVAPQPAPDADFWNAFDDPLLTRLVDEALLANHDLRIALTRYDRANALLRGARFDAFPTLTASGQASDTRASADQMPGATRDQRDGESYSAGIDMAWELDLFGRVRRNVEANRAGTAAAAADLAALQVAIVAEVARSYIDLRGLQERLQVARDNADNQRETLRIVQARLDAGSATGFDRARASAQLEATLARVPALEAEAAVMMNRLAVLAGKTPGALAVDLATPTGLPTLPAPVDPGTPGELLRRRPDIAAAEHRLHAATARIGVATADLFPRFTLGGLIGSQAIDAGDLFERDSEARVVALGIDWSFLDIGRVRARIAAADADAAGELARYQKTVALALEETENALVRHARTRAEDRHLQQAAADSTRAAELARLRYDAGATGLLEVLDAERTRLQAQDALADVRTRAANSAVAVYKAMAGGWPGRLPVREDIAGVD
ncbi:efflux transporter outer membrane subunit [Novilysobacter arseniciresistens]|uniref:efflux transporter outer membrane subunit n=1 Tax=Novilysobacter arseniciresistens TaxID=1385522 RepID=UPI0005609CEC|nr:efflux transporter outer membrane subunit [Lysobacter arseniciresistens]